MAQVPSIDQNKLATDYNYRQSLRDQGFYVGAGSNGSVVVESGSGQQLASIGGGGGSNQGNAENPAAGPAPAAPGPTAVAPDNQIYQTPNGPRTLNQIRQELSSAGYGGDKGTDPASLFTVYAMTATAGMKGDQAAKDAAAKASADAATRAYQAQQQAAQAAITRQQDIANQLAQQNFQLQQGAAQDAHAKAIQDLQLARNADQRAQALLDIQTAQQKLAEITQAETKRQFDVNLQQRQAEFNQTQYTDLAKNLLSGAANLRGPADWAKYTQNVTGGRALNDTLFGSNPSPKFAAPAGYTPPVSVGGVLGDLGYLPGGTAGGQPQQPIGQMVPLPHQWDPSTWDSLPDTGKQLVLGLAQAGNTSSGAWDPNDYLKIITAARPAGTASRSTTPGYGPPTVSSF